MMIHAQCYGIVFLALSRFLYNSFVRAWFQKERTSLVDLASVVQRFTHVCEREYEGQQTVYMLFLILEVVKSCQIQVSTWAKYCKIKEAEI